MPGLLIAFAMLSLLPPKTGSAMPQVKATYLGTGKYAYVVASSGSFLKIDTGSQLLEARWELRWVQGGSQLFAASKSPDEIQIKANENDLYALIAMNGRDNPAPSWHIVRFSLPSLTIAATAELNGVLNLPMILGASHNSVMIGWSDGPKMVTTITTLDPGSLHTTAVKKIPNTVLSNRAFARVDQSKIVDGIAQIDVATGKSDVFPVYLSLPPEQRAILDKEFSTPDPATGKPFTALGARDTTTGMILLSADAPKEQKTAFWTFNLQSREASQIFVKPPAAARITPSGTLMVLQHAADPSLSDSTGEIEIINTSTGESHSARFPQLKGLMSVDHFLCVADDGAIFTAQDGIYVLPLPSAASLTRINTNLVTDKDQTCTLAIQ